MTWLREHADAEAEYKCDIAWQRGLDYELHIGRRPHRLEKMRRDILADARIVLEAAGDPVTAAKWARDWARQSEGGDVMPDGAHASYRWARVAIALEDGEVR